MIFDKKMFIFPYKSRLLHFFLLFSSKYGDDSSLMKYNWGNLIVQIHFIYSFIHCNVSHYQAVLRKWFLSFKSTKNTESRTVLNRE